MIFDNWDVCFRSLTSSNDGGTVVRESLREDASPIKPLSPHLFSSSHQTDSTQVSLERNLKFNLCVSNSIWGLMLYKD